MHSFFKNNIFSISLGTALSKLTGFLRQTLIAPLFGLGVAYDAFNYAYIVPSFLIIIIGGINGPLHNAIVAVLTPLEVNKARQILQNISLKVTLLFFIIGLLIFLNPELIINIVGAKFRSRDQINSCKAIKNLIALHPIISF